jgi:hypothetical protein
MESAQEHSRAPRRGVWHCIACEVALLCATASSAMRNDALALAQLATTTAATWTVLSRQSPTPLVALIVHAFCQAVCSCWADGSCIQHCLEQLRFATAEEVHATRANHDTVTAVSCVM